MLLAGSLSDLWVLSYLFLDSLRPPVRGMFLATVGCSLLCELIKKKFFADMATDETDLNNSSIVTSSQVDNHE